MAKGRAGMNVERLVLSGVIVTTFLSSIIVLLTSLLDAAKLAELYVLAAWRSFAIDDERSLADIGGFGYRRRSF